MKVKAMSGSLKDCVAIISAKSLAHRRAYYVTAGQTIPYNPTSESMVNHEVDLFGSEQPKGFLTVPGRDDAKAVAFERIREEALNRVLVVYEQDGRGVRHVA